MTAVSLVRLILAIPKTMTGVCSCRAKSALAKETSLMAFLAPISPGVLTLGSGACGGGGGASAASGVLARGAGAVGATGSLGAAAVVGVTARFTAAASTCMLDTGVRDCLCTVLVVGMVE